jgi:methionyl aminopeptidase
MRRSAKIASNTLAAVEKYAKAGMTCDDLDKFVHDTIINQNAYPTPIGFMGFPKSVCLSVN